MVDDPGGDGTVVLSANSRAYLQSPFTVTTRTHTPNNDSYTDNQMQSVLVVGSSYVLVTMLPYKLKGSMRLSIHVYLSFSVGSRVLARSRLRFNRGRALLYVSI